MRTFIASREPSPRSSRRGFTLIELLVVVAIIGMLASVVLASLNGAREQARDARRLSDLRQVQTALELYYSSNRNNYPASASGNYLAGVTGLTPNHIASLPVDPNYTAGTGNDYQYWTDRPINGYTLAAYIEGIDGWCRVTEGGVVPSNWTSYPLCSDL